MLTLSQAARSKRVTEALVLEAIESGTLRGRLTDDGWFVDAGSLAAWNPRRPS